MTRFSYLLFTMLYIALLYYIMLSIGVKREALASSTAYFITPFIALNMAMSIFSLIRWFMKQRPEVSQEGITFLHAAWMGSLVAFLGYRYVLVGGVATRMFNGLF